MKQSLWLRIVHSGDWCLLLVVHEGKEEDSSVGECTGPTSTDDLGAGNKRTSEVPGQRCSSSRVTCWKAWRAPVTCGEQVRMASLVVGSAAGSQVSWSSSRQSWSRHSLYSFLSSQTQHTRLKHTSTQTRRLYIQTDTTHKTFIYTDRHNTVVHSLRNTHTHTHTEVYTVWVTKNPPYGFLKFFPKRLGIFNQFFYTPIVLSFLH